MPDLMCVEPARVDRVWPHVRPMIAKAMIRGGLNTLAEIEPAILGGVMLVWIAWDVSRIMAAAVTQLNDIDGKKTGTIVACGGNGLEDFAPLIEGLEAHFRAEGCKASRIMGRPGWSRIYPDYMMKAIILEKAL